jgi:hypothetical protein
LKECPHQELELCFLHDLSYYMREGGHGMVPTDWDIYIRFLKMHLHPEQ